MAAELAERPVDPKDRRTFLGGSDAPAALGVDPWRTRSEVWLEKTGRLEESDDGQDDVPVDPGPAYWGTELEDKVAQHWSRVAGMPIRRTSRDYQHKKHPFILGHFDRIIPRTDRFYEGKCTGAWMSERWGDTGTDDVPLPVRIQVAAYFAVAPRFNWCEIGTLIGGNQFRMFTIERNQPFVDKVVGSLASFWHDYVLADREPPPLSLDDAKALWPLNDGDKTVELDELEEKKELLATWRRRHELDDELAELQAKRDAVDLELLEVLGDAANLHCDELEQNLATWKLESRAVLDQARLRREKPHLFKQYLRLSATRVLRVKKPRKGGKRK